MAKATQYRTAEKMLALGKTAVENFLQYGSIDWYQWCNKNWGTKWNAYGYDRIDIPSQDNILTYLTAWNGALEPVAALSRRFPDVEFQYEYADEDVGVNVGRMGFLGGETIYEDIPEAQSREAYEMAFDIMECSADDYDLIFNAQTQTYEYCEEMSMDLE